MVAYNHNEHYLPLVLRQVPVPCSAALDVGCGDGRLLARLPELSDAVVGIDPDPGCVERASALGWERVAVIQDDFLKHDFGGRSFDFVAAVASIHHMPFVEALRKMEAVLRPGGRICIVGLHRAATPTDHLVALAAAPVNAALGWLRDTPRMGAPAMPSAMTLGAIRAESRSVLPWSQVRRLLLWRYLLTWTKPAVP